MKHAAAAALSGHGVVLEPIEARHLDELSLALDDEVWRYQPQARGALPQERSEHRAWLERWFEASQAGLASGAEIVFVVRRLSDANLVGSTRYLNIAWPHRRLEIGGTFYRADARATEVNPACKRLLLGRAFDELGCLRVELKCDARNVRSRDAILRLGAIEEGTLRHHMILGDGHLRDTVYFSILLSEWPSVRDRLDARLAARREPGQPPPAR